MKILRTQKDKEIENNNKYLNLLESKNGGFGFDDKTRTITYHPYKDSKGNEVRKKRTFETQEDYDREKSELRKSVEKDIADFRSYNKSLKGN